MTSKDLSRLLPRTAHQSLQIVLLLLTLLWAALTVAALIAFVVEGPSLARIVVALFCATIGAALFRCVMWARYLTVALLWMLALAPIALLGPFGDMDRHAAGAAPIALATKWTIVVLFDAVVLFFIHSLGKYKAEFRRTFF